jgi:hypothetical protein
MDLRPSLLVASYSFEETIANLNTSRSFDMPLLETFISAPPTAELEPITDDYVQSDEVDSKTYSPGQISFVDKRNSGNVIQRALCIRPPPQSEQAWAIWDVYIFAS